ncbi:hypothetical protein Pmani_009862, partial [Petrolisthes manimaculis]
KPYCRRHSKTIYGTALHEPASVTCEVEASPGPVTFRWTFNNTSEHLPIPASAVTSQDFMSVASYAPKSHLDYGTLLCWAFNDIGEQSTPCAFAIIAAGPPDPPKNCSIANRTSDTIWVECVAGFDGGLPQTFYIEVYDSSTGALHSNISSPDPLFLVTALRPGLSFLMVTYAANAKGRSDVAKLETFMMKVAEKRTGPPALFEFTPVLGILIGVALAFLLTALVVMVVMKMRRTTARGRGGDCGGPNDELKGDLENKPLNVGVLVPRVKEGSSTGEAEDNDPDIIPHKTGERRVMEGQQARLYLLHGRCHARPPSPHHITTQHNQSPSGGSVVTYVGLPLPKLAQPGYQVTATDLCLFAAKRRSVYLNAAATSAGGRPSSTSPPPGLSHTPSTTTTNNNNSQHRPATSSIGTCTTEDEEGHIYATVLPTGVQEADRTRSPSPRHIYASVSTSFLNRGQRSDSPEYTQPDYHQAVVLRARHQGASLPRPKSVSSLAMAAKMRATNPALVNNTSIYATTSRRLRKNPVNLPRSSHNRPYEYCNSLHRRSLQSPTDSTDRETSRTPLLSSPMEKIKSHSPSHRSVITSRSLVRIPTESSV